MIRYKYDETNYKYIGEHECQESPLEPGQYLYPPNTTEVAPPFDQPGVYHYSESTNTWVVFEDRSKRIWYHKSNGELVENYDVNLEYTYTEDPRPHKFSIYNEFGYCWVDDVDGIKSTAMDILSEWKNYLYDNKITVENIGDVNGGERSYNAVMKLIEYLKFTKNKTVNFKMFDNTYQKLTSKDLENIRNEFVKLEQELFAYYQDMKTKISKVSSYGDILEVIDNIENNDKLKEMLKNKFEG